MAAILDDLEISDEARSALNDALGAQAASVKLIAASVANAVAAVHASKGNSSEFAALLHGLQGDVTPAFVTDVRFAAMRKAAAASETVDAVRKNVLGVAHPNSSRSKKYASRRFSFRGKGIHKEPRWQQQRRDDLPQNPTQPETERPDQTETKPRSTTTGQRPFRSYSRPRGRK